MIPVCRNRIFHLVLGFSLVVIKSDAFLSSAPASFSRSPILLRTVTLSATSPTTAATMVPSWTDLVNELSKTPVGLALNQEVELRKQGKGSAHVHNTLRKFDSDEDPKIILYRDHAGWCPYCQKTMLLVEEKRIPLQISLINMRSYGDKPADFLRKVPGGLLPAIEVNGRIITESQVIMELFDQEFGPDQGFRPMLPSDDANFSRYQKLARLERDLFSWWCTLVFRPEGPKVGGNLLSKFLSAPQESSAAMQGFLDCMRKVDRELQSTKGPWFFDTFDYPSMIDFIYVSHVERMLASCAYWKGLNLRDPKWDLKGLTAWLEAFEKREAYLAFKSDYYTHVMDIPPQYGPGYDGGFDEDREKFARNIRGLGISWRLPLSHDDELQPLYKGPPLPLCVLASMDISPDSDGSYESCDPIKINKACRMMAAWKLAGNGPNVAKFASRGGPAGGQNPRKSFGAPLADPYAQADTNIQPSVDTALRVVCAALRAVDEQSLPSNAMADALCKSVPKAHVSGVVSSLAYVRDRVGVPRDLPLAAARYLRAYLNWGIETLNAAAAR